MGGQAPQMLMFGGGGDQQGPWLKFQDMLAPKFTKRSFIFVMIVLQVLYFIVSLIVGQAMFDGAFVVSNSLAGPSGLTLRELGAKCVNLIQSGQVFRFITPVFLHGGLLHLSVNLYFQFALAFRFEEDWGWKRMAVIYFLTAWGATAMSCIGSPGSISVGASGALFGLMGAEVANLVINWSSIPQRGMRMCNVVMLLIINAIIGASLPGIDNWAHLGGFISGLFIGSFCVPVMGELGVKQLWVRRVGFALAIAYLVSFTIGTFFITGGNSICSP